MIFLLISLLVLSCGNRSTPVSSKPKDLNCETRHIVELVNRSCMPCHEPGNGRIRLHTPRHFRYYITKAMTWSDRGHGNPPFSNKELWELNCWYHEGNNGFK